MDNLDRRLAALDRAPSVAPAALDALAVDARREARRSRRWRILAAVLVSALAGGGLVAAPAAADGVRQFLAQATWFEASGTEVIPNSEWLDVGASDLDEYIEYVYKEDFVMPPGMTREQIIARTQKAFSGGGEGVMQDIGIFYYFEMNAYCGWNIEMVAAEKAGDEERYQAAVAVLAASVEWPATVAIDGGGVRDAMTQYAQRAAAHDPSARYDIFRMGECEYLGFSTADIE